MSDTLSCQPWSLQLSSPHVTPSGLLRFKVDLHSPPPPGLIVHAVSVNVIQRFALSSFKDPALRRTPLAETIALLTMKNDPGQSGSRDGSPRVDASYLGKRRSSKPTNAPERAPSNLGEGPGSLHAGGGSTDHSAYPSRSRSPSSSGYRWEEESSIRSTSLELLPCSRTGSLSSGTASIDYEDLRQRCLRRDSQTALETSLSCPPSSSASISESSDSPPRSGYFGLSSLQPSSNRPFSQPIPELRCSQQPLQPRSPPYRDVESFTFSDTVRLPDGDSVRPSTQETSITGIRVSHELEVEVMYSRRTNANAGGNEKAERKRVLHLRKNIEVASVSLLSLV